MPAPITPSRPLPFAIRRIVACGACGGRRRTLVDTSDGLRARCMGCGADIAFPFAVEDSRHVVGRAGQVVVHG
jgi:hypothetical protein